MAKRAPRIAAGASHQAGTMYAWRWASSTPEVAFVVTLVLALVLALGTTWPWVAKVPAVVGELELGLEFGPEMELTTAELGALGAGFN